MVDGFEIIDAHCHPIALNGKSMVNHWGHPVTTGDFFSEMRSFGIDLCCGSVVNKNDCLTFDPILRFNTEVMALQKEEPDYFYPGIHIHPRFVKESIAELEKAHKAGFRWVGELVPYITGYDSYVSREMLEILAAARDLGMAVNMHPTNDEECDKLMSELPGLTAIWAHPGETAKLPHRAELMKKHRNLHWDISGTGLFRWGMLKYLVNTCGAEKLLFGTDFPICSIPMQIYGVLGERISDDDRKAIFSGNFRRIIGK